MRIYHNFSDIGVIRTGHYVIVGVCFEGGYLNFAVSLAPQVITPQCDTDFTVIVVP